MFHQRRFAVTMLLICLHFARMVGLLPGNNQYFEFLLLRIGRPGAWLDSHSTRGLSIRPDKMLDGGKLKQVEDSLIRFRQ